jgi:hypothetical protein
MIAILILTSSLVYANITPSTDEKEGVPASTITEQTATTDALLDEAYVSKGISVNSPNGETNAEIIKKNYSKFDSIILSKNNESQIVDLENIIYTSIVSYSWIDDVRFAICGHINPSLNVYVVIDTKSKKIIGEYYGIGFTWNQNKDKLYYIQTSTYFGDGKVNDKIVDNIGNIYYETEPGISMTDKLSISDNEQTFVFFVNDSISNARKFYITTLNKNNKLEKKTEIDAPTGDIKINMDKIIITDPEGTINNYDLN